MPRKVLELGLLSWFSALTGVVALGCGGGGQVPPADSGPVDDAGAPRPTPDASEPAWYVAPPPSPTPSAQAKRAVDASAPRREPGPAAEDPETNDAGDAAATGAPTCV